MQYGDVEMWSGDYEIYGKKVITYMAEYDETEYFYIKEITRNKMVTYNEDPDNTETFRRKK